MSATPRIAAACAALGLALAGCGGGGDRKGEGAGAFSAQVASYDLAVGRDQRVSVGLVAGQEGLVGYGTVELAFAYAGTKDAPVPSPKAGPPATATFQPVPGHKPDPAAAGPRVVSPTEVVGVYATTTRFDRPGLWQVTATARVEGKSRTATDGFEVAAEPKVPAPGQPAPRTENLLPGAEGAPPKAVDSRAEPDGSVPDPELHGQTVAAAIASGRPTMVVISTPVYCQSRFCGPITDSVQRLAAQHGGRMNFVHVEVWRDFQAQTINKAAAEWIFRSPDQEINEPWVFVVDGRGTISDRFDNVASDGELAAAVDRALR